MYGASSRKLISGQRHRQIVSVTVVTIVQEQIQDAPHGKGKVQVLVDVPDMGQHVRRFHLAGQVFHELLVNQLKEQAVEHAADVGGIAKQFIVDI